ncbi:hypothetical protein [Mucilaginibacter sp. NFR10]|uniref:hypothetical protein n=1 Tax=Mucilaginibacter sp. NFR10 TaxID=1566292 RepID=UPI000871704D|nr:hypothetical protein [Mucilaginibacter sp. NFR10]SCW44529.1 hypothetical protein SAMN03159284_00808 [Mucilaginibacter sp. NFR10]
MDINKKRKVKPEDAVRILKEHGTIVILEEAQIILNLSYDFARIAVAQQKRENKISEKA